MLREHYKRNLRDEIEINLIPFINFLVVLIPVLMLSAEFAQINILPASPVRQGYHPDTLSSTPFEATSIAIGIGDSAISIADGSRLFASIPCTPRFLPATEISAALSQIRSHAGAKRNEIAIASDDRVKYQRLIDVMDIARKTGFTDISVGRLRG
jgi:biopolymer transport protein ExbD